MFDISKAQSFFRRFLAVAEKHIKVPAFDCSMCGQCVVRSHGMTCPMQCPKQMRNGPCGGSTGGECEVFPDRQCTWVKIHDKMESRGKEENLVTIQPPVDWRLWGTSAWSNLAEKRIDSKGHARSERITEEWNERKSK